MGQCVPNSTTSGGKSILNFTTAGTCIWTVPAGVTSIQVEAWGAGGNGGAGGGGRAGGGGGGGFSGIETYAVTPGQTFSISVDAAGFQNAGADFSQVLRISDNAVVLRATGGGNGSSNSSGAAGQCSSGCTVGNAGGVGGPSGNTTWSGSGGGAGNWNSTWSSPCTTPYTNCPGNGKDGTASATGGVAGTSTSPSTGGGGAGAAGRNSNGAGFTATAIGGGGGGGRGTGAAGAGFRGQVRITYTLPGENCTNAQDLTTLTSPFSGTTVGYANDISTCITGAPDRIFYIDVPNNSTITFQETANNYDEYEYIGYGATCPGATQIQCWDNDALNPTVWTNTTGSTQRVWYVQDGLSGGSGAFTLTWSLQSPCTAPTTQASNITASSITSSGASINWTNGNGAGRVVYVNTTNSFVAPTNGTNPTANTVYASGQQCVFNGTASGPVSLTGLAGGTTYYVRVYEYCTPTRNYQTATVINNPNSFTTITLPGENCTNAQDLTTLTS
ncbi:MAG: hypothetical protein ACOVOV_09795, partial [Dolichospermum sp.]